MIDRGSASTLWGHLQNGETLIWEGKPGTGFKLRPSDAYLVPFSILWCGFAIYWEASVIGGNAPWLFRLWGVPFVLVGIYLVVGRFIWDALVRRHQVYGVTNSRVIILNQFPRVVLRSFDLASLPSLTLIDRGGATGSISFTDSSASNSEIQGWGTWVPSHGGTSFEFIQNPRQIYSTIMGAQREARREFSTLADSARSP